MGFNSAFKGLITLTGVSNTRCLPIIVRIVKQTGYCLLHAFFWVIPRRPFSSQTVSHINTPTFSTPVILHTYPPMKMEQTGSETLNSDAGELPRRKHTAFRTWRKFEIKDIVRFSPLHLKMQNTTRWRQ